MCKRDLVGVHLGITFSPLLRVFVFALGFAFVCPNVTLNTGGTSFFLDTFFTLLRVVLGITTSATFFFFVGVVWVTLPKAGTIGFVTNQSKPRHFLRPLPPPDHQKGRSGGILVFTGSIGPVGGRPHLIISYLGIVRSIIGGSSTRTKSPMACVFSSNVIGRGTWIPDLPPPHQ